ncbi:PLP-dependent aminotransferase family protein [Agarivorans albus]|uniref:aminotransferase-like domain-containing protein n=1 Tax=Agarivorans albus TaxID=182262 RepID=UPI00058EC584|nr:PLP-dependent aminotransferase family protein [Agarivorans albus]
MSAELLDTILLGFNPKSRPLYLEIARCIENAILKGQIAYQDKLPSHRTLASEIGSSAVTVRQAYQELENKALLSSGIGKGTFVSFNVNLSAGIKGRTQNELNLSLVAPLNGPLLKPLSVQLSALANADLSAYCDYEADAGNPEQLAVLHQWLKTQGIDCEQSQVIVCHGAQHALLVAVLACTQVGDRVAVESLCYPGILSVLRQTGRIPVPVALDEQGLVPNSLERLHEQQTIRALMLVASCQNPTGTVMPNQRREQLAKVVKRCAIQVIDDDIYGFLAAEEIKPFFHFAPQQSIYLTSLSKCVSPSLRLGLLVVPKSSRDDYINLVRTTVWLPSPLLMQLACQLITSGAVAKVTQWQKRQALARQNLAKTMLNELEFVNQHLAEHSAYHLWLYLPLGWTSQAFVEVMLGHHIHVSGEQHFRFEGKQRPAVRISLMATQSLSDLKHALGLIRDVLLRRI